MLRQMRSSGWSRKFPSTMQSCPKAVCCLFISSGVKRILATQKTRWHQVCPPHWKIASFLDCQSADLNLLPLCVPRGPAVSGKKTMARCWRICPIVLILTSFLLIVHAHRHHHESLHQLIKDQEQIQVAEAMLRNYQGKFYLPLYRHLWPQ